MTEVHLHFAKVEQTAAGSRQSSEESKLDCLSADEIARAGRFVFDRDRAWYVTAHRFLRQTLAGYLGCNARNVEFVAGSHGRPELADRRLRFNLSHTHGLVMVGVTDSADLGVDCEEIARPIDMESIAPVVFTPGERKTWDGERAPFFRTWTLKESYVKARGEGLSLDLQSFGFDQDTPPRMRCAPRVDDAAAWQFAVFTPTSRHCAAAAVRADDVRWIVHGVSS